METGEYSEYDDFTQNQEERNLEATIQNSSTRFTESQEERNAEFISVASQVFCSQKVKEKRHRTKNFTRQEDELLISAWQNVSLDPITGADKKMEPIGRECKATL